MNKTINNKKQRRCTNNRQFASKVSNRNINNYNIPDLFQPSASYSSAQSFINNSNSGFFSFMNNQTQTQTQTQNYYQDNSFNPNRTAYNFTDNMLNYNSYNSYNFSSNQNPFAQTSYTNNSEYYYNNSNCNYTCNSNSSFNSQMGNSYCSSNQSRYVSKYKLVNKRN